MSTNNPYAPPVAAVRDIPAVYANTELADLLPRLGAAILDGIIFMGMVYVPGLIVAMVMGLAAASTDNRDAGTVVGFMAVAVMLVGLVVWAWLTIKYVNENGQSIAKKIVGIKVVRSDGSRASLARIFWLRNVVNSLPGLLGYIGIAYQALIDPLFIFQDSRQCLHDKLADTIVIRCQPKA